MKIYSSIVLIFFITTFIFSCRKNDLTDGAPVVSSPLTDSVLILKSVKTWDGGSCTFTYDTLKKRYTNFYFSYNSNNWDSTFINYNVNGSVLNLINKVYHPVYNYSITPTVLAYNNDSLISKIYKKRVVYAGQYSNNYLTDISNPNSIDYYDSLNYDTKRRIISSYRIYYEIYRIPYYVTFYRKFYYQPSNDTLLSKIDLYDRDVAGNFRLYETFNFNGFDKKGNPFFKGFSLYGLLTPYITKFYAQPNTYSSSLSDFLTATPQNCNQISIIKPISGGNFTSNVNYTYNSDSLPTKASYADPSEYVLFFYTKIPK